MRPTYEDVVILVIAHPDDESMFFFPTLARLSAERPVHILCLSDGGYDGCGPARDRAAEPWLVRGPPPPLQVRRREMYSAAMRFGATASVVEDPRLQDGGEWDACVVAEVARRGIEASFAVRGSCRRCVVTFDERGASGHKNHASTSRGLVLLRLASESQADSLFGTRFFELESAPFTSRFLGMLAVPVGLVRSRVDPQPSVLYANLDVITAFCALAVHETQFVWFRKLFLVFSSYTFLNRLIEIQRPIMPIHSLR